MADGLHAAIIVGMHPKPLGTPICFVGNNNNTRVNVDADLPSELSTRGVSEDVWKMLRAINFLSHLKETTAIINAQSLQIILINQLQGVSVSSGK